MLKIISIFILFLYPFSRENPGKDWQLKTDKNGIKVFTKSVPGSGVDAEKSVYNANSSLSAITKIFTDIPSYPKWIYRCTKSEVLKTISPTELIYYQETSVPWPASNRDLIGHVKISQDPATLVVTITAENMPQYVPEKSGIVRLKTFHEVITIVPKGKDVAEISYELFLDPGGSIPAWMVNLASVEGPYESSLAMVKLLASGAYKNTSLPYIKEP